MSDDTVTIGGTAAFLSKALADHPHVKEFTFRRETLEALVAVPTGLRDEFAKAALTGILCTPHLLSLPHETTASEQAYRYADAMLAAREGK